MYHIYLGTVQNLYQVNLRKVLWFSKLLELVTKPIHAIKTSLWGIFPCKRGGFPEVSMRQSEALPSALGSEIFSSVFARRNLDLGKFVISCFTPCSRFSWLMSTSGKLLHSKHRS